MKEGICIDCHMCQRDVSIKKKIVSRSENLVPSGRILKIGSQNPNQKHSIYVYQTHSPPSYPTGTREHPSGTMPNRPLVFLLGQHGGLCRFRC